MKKLLALISSIAVISTPVIASVSCGKGLDARSDAITATKKQVEKAIKEGNLSYTTKQNKVDQTKYFTAIKEQLIKLFDQAQINYDKSQFQFTTEFKEEWFNEAKNHTVNTYIEIKDGFNFNESKQSFKIEQIAIKLNVEKNEKTDLNEVITVKRLDFENKSDASNLEKLTSKIKEQNSSVNTKYITVALNENNVNTHKASVKPFAAEGNESIYKGEVDLNLVTPLDNDIIETQLGAFSGEADLPSKDEIHAQILAKNLDSGYNQDNVEILDITTTSAVAKAETDGFYSGEVTVTYDYSKKNLESDLSNFLKDSSLKLQTKEPTEDNIKEQIKTQNSDINIDAVAVKDIDLQNHSATAVGDGEIYTGSVNLILQYDINIDISTTDLQVYGMDTIPTENEVLWIVKKYNPALAIEQVKFLEQPTKSKAVLTGKADGFYYNQVEVTYKYISFGKALEIVKTAEIKVQIKLNATWNTFLVAVRDYLKAEIKEKTDIVVPDDFGIQTGWNAKWTSPNYHKVGDVFEVRTWITITTGFGEKLPTISGSDHPAIQITIIA